MVAMPQLDCVKYLERCAEIRATTLSLVPSTAIRLVKDSAVSKLDLMSVSILFSSGVSLPVEVAEKLQVQLKGCAIIDRYW